MPQTRKPPDLDENGNPIVEGVTPPIVKSKIEAKAKTTKPPDLDEKGNSVDEESPGIMDSISGWMKEHPRIREMGERFLTGTSPEYEQMLKEHGITEVGGPPEKEGSILPEWKSQPETFMGGFAKSLYNDFVRPQASPSGIIGWASLRYPGTALERLSPKEPEQIGNARRYWPSESPLRRSREIPYRADIPTITDITKPPTPKPRGLLTAGEPISPSEPPLRPPTRDLEVPHVSDELVERLQSDNPPIIDDKGGTDWIPEPDTTPPSDPVKLQRFLDTLRGATGATPEGPKPFVNPFTKKPVSEKPPDLNAEGEPEEPLFSRTPNRAFRSDSPLRPDLGLEHPSISRETFAKIKARGEDATRAWENSVNKAKALGIDIKGMSHDQISEAIYNKRQELGLKPGEEPPPLAPEEPSFAKSERGGIKVGQDIRRSAGELTTGYSNPLEGIMVREGMQNAIDAVRHLGPEGKIRVETGGEPENEYLQISDNGKGMNRQELETVFSDLHSSGKTTEAGATGGKGVGKATYMLGGERFKVETVVLENGEKVKRTIEGTPEEFMTHADINEEIVPPETPAGTTIQINFKKDQLGYHARDMVDNILENTRGIQAKVAVNRYGFKGTDKETNFPSGQGDKLIGKQNINNNDVSIIVPDGADLKPRTLIKVNYLNNGMHQFSSYHYLVEETPNMPDQILVDIHPGMEEGTSEYPFPVQRESIKDKLAVEIKKMIDDKLAYPELNTKKNHLKELYEAMSANPMNTPDTKRKIMFFDPGNRLSGEELAEFHTNPIVNEIAKHFDNVIDSVLSKVGNQKWSDRLEGVGLVLDRNMYGVHIPNPTSGKSTILINPFEHMLATNPTNAALDSIITGLHEVAHIGAENPTSAPPLSSDELTDPRVGRYLESYLRQAMSHGGIDIGHGMSFIHRLGEVYAKYGPKQSLQAADKIEQLVTDETGGYSPEVQRLLQIYQESRGRPEVTEDLLSGTGAKQATRGTRKGDSSGTNPADGERISPIQSAVNKLFKALEEARGLRGEQEAINKAERARRFAASAGVKQEGMAGAAKSLGKMKGEFEKVEGPTIEGLSKEETDTLFTAIKRANITEPEKLKGYVTLFKLIEGGNVPARSELAVLDDVFGGGFASKIVELHGGLGAIGVKIGKAANTMKAMSSSIDMSAFRQGIGLAYRKEFYSAAADYIKFMRNKEFFDATMSTIEDDPMYLVFKEAGLFLAKHDKINATEEAFANNYVGSIPKWTGIPLAVDASERGYVGFLNKLRFDTLKNMVEQAKGLGHVPFTVIEKDGVKTIIPSESTEGLARFVNVNSGRGGLGAAEKYGQALNNFFWSPRLLSARVQSLLNPKMYTDMPKGMRLEQLKSLLAIAGIAVGANILGAAAGGKLNYNILSSDFGKIRFGPNKVLDPMFGYQQIIVAAARFITGQNEVKPQSRLDTLGNFAKSKESPAASLAHEILGAKKFTEPSNSVLDRFSNTGKFIDQYNKPTSVQRETVMRFIPMFTQDLYDLYSNEPRFSESVGLNIALGAAAGVGVGVQGYKEKSSIQPRGTGMRKMRLSP